MARLLALALVPFAIQAPADPGFAGFAMKLPAPKREQLEAASGVQAARFRYPTCGCSP